MRYLERCLLSVAVILAFPLCGLAQPPKPPLPPGPPPGFAPPEFKPAPKVAKTHVPQPTFNSVAEAGADYQVQGEYVGKIRNDEGEVQQGVQIIALGDGTFRAVGYHGGLPGAGWDRSETIEVEGSTVGGQTTFTVSDPPITATVADGVMTIKEADGHVLGTLKKTTRESPTLGAKYPAGAIVLFDGANADAFENGQMENGLLLEGCTSKRTFKDHTLHLEFRTPFMPYSRGQSRGNSGVYVQGRYEIQILDSFGLEGADNECGGIYKASKPAVNMCLPPLAWQTYDIEFTAARFQDGTKTQDAKITVKHNGVVIHQDLKLPAVTPGGKLKTETEEAGPLFLQNHRNPVRFRNIWVVEK